MKMAETQRVTSGIKGLDKLMEGGYVKGSANLITGSTGSGKSTFLLQFCWEGLQRGENALYITLEETPDELVRDALQFGWDLEKYRNKRGKEIAIIAAHPYFYGNISLKERLEKYASLFDAIEHSWFYSRIFNRNNKARIMSLRLELPLVATSDTHFFYRNHMERNYAFLDVDKATIPAVIYAIKNGNIENFTKPSSTLIDMFFLQTYFQLFKGIKRMLKRP